MKKYLLIALISICLSTKAQQTPTNKTRSNNDFSQVDNYLIGLKRLGIPTSETDNLDAAGLPQNTIKLIYNTTLGKLRVYNPVLTTWSDAIPIDLAPYYTKVEIDNLFASLNSNILHKIGNETKTGDLTIHGAFNTSDGLGHLITVNPELGTIVYGGLQSSKDATGYWDVIRVAEFNNAVKRNFGNGQQTLEGSVRVGENSDFVASLSGDGIRQLNGYGSLVMQPTYTELSYPTIFTLNKNTDINRIIFDDLEIRNNRNNKKVLWTGDALPFTGGTLTGKLNINDANDFPIELSGNGVSFGTAFNSTHYGNLGNYFTATSGFLAKLGADMRFEGIANNYNIGMWGDHLAVSSNKGGMIRFIDENIYAYDQGNMRPFLKGNTSTPQNNQLYLGDYNNQMIFDNLGLRGLNNNAFEVGIRMTGGGGLDIGASGAPTKFFQNSEQIFGLYDKIYAYKDIISTGNLSMNTGRGISFADGVGDRVDAIKYKDYGLHIGNVSNVANFTGIHLTGDGSTDAISVYHDNQVGLADFAAPIFNYKLLVRDENGAMRQVAKQDLGYAAMNTANPIGGNLKIESAVVAGSFRTNDNMFSVSTDVANNEITIQQGSSGNINLNGYTIVAANNIQAGGQIKSDSKIISPSYRVSALQIAPATANDSGEAGEIRITAGYIYVCIATNEWVRTSLTTW